MSEKATHLDNEESIPDTQQQSAQQTDADQTHNNTANEARAAISDEPHVTEDNSSSQDYEAKIAELNDKMLRAVAESENVRRRAETDIAKARDFSIEALAKDMISVLENLYRASESISEDDANASEHLKNVKEGVEITKRDMLNAFERHKIIRINPLNEKFDHNVHQAMSQVDSDEVEPGTVIQVIQAGYTIKGRLLRPALVVLAKAK